MNEGNRPEGRGRVKRIELRALWRRGGLGSGAVGLLDRVPGRAVFPALMIIAVALTVVVSGVPLGEAGGVRPVPGGSRVGSADRTGAPPLAAQSPAPAAMRRPLPAGANDLGISPVQGWVLWNRSTNPPARDFATMVDDPAEGGALLFGGISAGNVALNDTWLMKGGQWTELCSGTSAPPRCAVSPPARYLAAMAYDPEERAVVLHGGDGPFNDFTDTWEFANGSWTNVTKTVQAPQGSMTFDAAAGYLLLFGTNGQTWKFTNGTWTMLTPVGRMPSTPGVLFYVGSMRGAILWNGETWEFQGGNWSRLGPTVSPPASFSTTYGYDSAAGYAAFFGPGGPPDNSTWEYANGTWSNATSMLGAAPPGETYAAMAYDSTDGYFVLLDELSYRGNANQTWLLRDPLTVNVTGSSPVRDVGQTVNFTITATGGVRPYSLNVTSAPPGCPVPPRFSNTTVVTCRLNQSGTFEFGVNLTDTLGSYATVAASLVVNPAPSVSVFATPNPTTVGIPVRLDGVVTGGTPPMNVMWRIGGVTNTNASWSPTFMGSGTYPAVFTAVDAVGDTISANVSVRVNPGLIVRATESQNVTDVGLRVAWNATAYGGTGPLTYAWEFGDGNSSAVPNPAHTFSRAGVYSPRLWVNDSVGAGTQASLSLLVNPALEANASASATRTTSGSRVTFSAVAAGGTAPYSYLWNFGNGDIALGATTTQAFMTSGVHTVSVTIYDSVGGSVVREVVVDVVAGPPPSPLPTGGSAGMSGYSLGIVVGIGIIGLGVGAGAAVLGVSRRARSGVGPASEPREESPGPVPGAGDGPRRG